MATPEKYSHIKFVPPSGVRREAEYGLKLRREHGRGGTAVGIARARDLSNGKEVSPSTVRRMKAYFDRHASDQQGEGFNQGDKGWPSNGYIAAKLWGGFQSGYSWAKKGVAQMNAADEQERSYSLDTQTRNLDVKEQTMGNVERRYLSAGGTENSTEGMLGVEHRADPETGEKRTYLVGYAAKFNTDSLLLGDFVERISPTAFEIVEKKMDLEGRPLETRGLFNHDPNHLIGRFPNTMNLTVDKIGLKYEILLPESRKDLAESVARGDLKGSSFSFVVAEGGEKWTREGGKSRRLVTKIKSLLDCGPVTYPAYRDSSVAVAKRSYEQFIATQEPEKAPTPPKPRTDIAAEIRKYQEFIGERRGDCGREEDGKFASGNSCGGASESGAGDSAWREGAKVGAIVGAGLGAFAGPGLAVGAAVGAIGGAIVGTTGLRGPNKSLEAAYKATKTDLSKVDKAAKALKMKMTISTPDGGKSIVMESGDNVAIVSNGSQVSGSKGVSMHFQPGADKDGKFDLAAVEKAAKSVGAKNVSVEAWHDGDVKKLEAKGYRRVGDSREGYSSSKGIYEKKLGKSKRSLADQIAESQQFMAERRGFCATGPGGGVDNSCGPGGKGSGGDTTGSKGGKGKDKEKEKPPKEKAGKKVGKKAKKEDTKDEEDPNAPTVAGHAALGAGVGAIAGTIAGGPVGTLVGTGIGATLGAASGAGHKIAYKVKTSVNKAISGAQKSAGQKLFGKSKGKAKKVDPNEPTVAGHAVLGAGIGAVGGTLGGGPGVGTLVGAGVGATLGAASGVGSKIGYKLGTSINKGISGLQKAVGQKVLGKKKRSLDSKKLASEMEAFLAERRGFCATGPGGGLDNSCGGKDGGGKSLTSDGKPDLAAKHGIGGGIVGKKPDLIGGGIVGKKSSDKEPSLPAGQLGGYKVQPKMGFEPKADSGKYKEWKKGDHLDKKKEKNAQDFLDKAREEQLSKGGKDKGKSDDGGGVQTWSKGDDFPWTSKQVGDTDGGYVQGQHPDGSKTEKYPFKGGDTSEAYKKVSEEIKAKKGKRSVDPRQVVEDTLRFLKERR